MQLGHILGEVTIALVVKFDQLRVAQHGVKCLHEVGTTFRMLVEGKDDPEHALLFVTHVLVVMEIHELHSWQTRLKPRQEMPIVVQIAELFLCVKVFIVCFN